MEVAVTVPARRLPMVEVDIVALMANRLVEVAEVEVERDIVKLVMVEVEEFTRMPPVRVAKLTTESVPVAVIFPPIKAFPPTVSNSLNVVVPIPNRLDEDEVAITKKSAELTEVPAE